MNRAPAIGHDPRSMKLPLLCATALLVACSTPPLTRRVDSLLLSRAPGAVTSPVETTRVVALNARGARALAARRVREKTAALELARRELAVAVDHVDEARVAAAEAARRGTPADAQRRGPGTKSCSRSRRYRGSAWPSRSAPGRPRCSASSSPRRSRRWLRHASNSRQAARWSASTSARRPRSRSRISAARRASPCARWSTRSSG